MKTLLLIVSIVLLFETSDEDERRKRLDVDAQSVLTYETPHLDNQFANFPITKYNQTLGKSPDADLDGAFTLNNRSYITFNFKGKGNAFLYFQEVAGEDRHSFTVEIGGRTDHSRVAVYILSAFGDTQPFAKEQMIDITSEIEYRSFWIFWIITVHVGLCNIPGKQEILQSPAFIKYSVNHISISTNSENNGFWGFGPDGSLYGACAKKSGCYESLACDLGDSASPTRGTCMPVEPDTTFGSGKCRFRSRTNVKSTRAPGFTETVIAADNYTSRLLSTSSDYTNASVFSSSSGVSSRSTFTTHSTRNICPDVGEVAIITAAVTIAVFVAAGVCICLSYSRCKSHIISPAAARDRTNGENEGSHDARPPHSV